MSDGPDVGDIRAVMVGGQMIRVNPGEVFVSLGLTVEADDPTYELFSGAVLNFKSGDRWFAVPAAQVQAIQTD
jgi:hypothetical protein